MIADGGECISDIATVGDQPAVFGAVASDSTCWRVLEAVTGTDLVAIDAARSAAREVAVGAARRGHRDHAAGFDGGRAAIAGCTYDAEAEFLVREVRNHRGQPRPGRYGSRNRAGWPRS